LNTWTHLASTYDGATLRLYVNGTLTGSFAHAGSINTTTGALRIGGNSVWGEYFNGTIDEVRVYNSALTAAQIQTDMITPISTGSSDTVAPTVALTSPSSGATLVGSVTLSANASDNVGVAGVQFLLDGAALGAEDTTSPYSITWDTTGATSGNHVLSARARDAAGNATTSGGVAVLVANTNPAQIGQWSSVLPFPIVAMN